MDKFTNHDYLSPSKVFEPEVKTKAKKNATVKKEEKDIYHETYY